MKELQLKYGCNPNQKPSRIYMENGSDLPVQVLSGSTGVHQFPGCVQWLAAGKGAEGSDRPSGSHFL